MKSATVGCQYLSGLPRKDLLGFISLPGDGRAALGRATPFSQAAKASSALRSPGKGIMSKLPGISSIESIGAPESLAIGDNFQSRSLMLWCWQSRDEVLLPVDCSTDSGETTCLYFGLSQLSSKLQSGSDTLLCDVDSAKVVSMFVANEVFASLRSRIFKEPQPQRAERRSKKLLSSFILKSSARFCTLPTFWSGCRQMEGTDGI